MNFHRWHRQALGVAMAILSSSLSSTTTLLSTNNNFLIIVIPIIIHGAASAFSVPYSNIHQRSQRRLCSGGLLSNTPPTFHLHPTTATTTTTMLSYQQQRQQKQHRWYHQNTVLYQAKPLRGSAVESYRTVGVNCSKCRTQLFRYKKKNGTKSNLVKCYIERIADDTAGLLEEFNNEEKNASSSSSNSSLEEYQWNCPSCGSSFARTRMIHGRPALKLVGGKIRMTK